MKNKFEAARMPDGSLSASRFIAECGRLETSSRITAPEFPAYVEACKAEAKRQWCYPELIDDHFDCIEDAFEDLEAPAEIVQSLGEEFDLTPASDWFGPGGYAGSNS